MPDCRLSGISGMGQWNGIMKWNTGISFNCIFVSLEYFLAPLNLLERCCVNQQFTIDLP